ncbi:DUF6461 domain-containing protein [Streptomyces sp. NPDC048650]|uniref:DUF6461 domain-containing protein n=1 Tax=unclassified Streptomyces TaxID=2593676 RepID=UPI003716D48C
MDLTDKYGEGWCITLAQIPKTDTLNLMGVPEPGSEPDGVAKASDRIADHVTEGGVLPLALELPRGWSLVLELEGTAGWIGAGNSVLGLLTAEGRTAVTVFCDPNQCILLAAADGAVIGKLDLNTGTFTNDVDQDHPVIDALAALGFDPTDEGDPTGAADTEDRPTLVTLAVQALTGVTLTDDDFEGHWVGGLCTTGPP